MRALFSLLVLISFIQADSIDEVMEGFDDTTTKEANLTEDDVMSGFDDEPTHKDETQPTRGYNDSGLSFTLSKELAYSLNAEEPHDGISSFKLTVFTDYDKKFENGLRVKANVKAFHNSIYAFRGVEKYTKDELDKLKSEIELFEAYIEGSLTDNLDAKIGRQVVVWGRSDTIRVTDVLNPIDNRRPAMVDIEDLRLPVAMAKFDYFIGDWRVTPIAILEQRFSKNPPFGGGFNPSPKELPDDVNYSDVTPAISIGGEFSNWDINLYASQLRADSGYLKDNKMNHDKTDMFGTALNILSGSWLFKSELAYFDKLKFTATGDEEFKRTDILFGAEYNGVADSMFSYDIVLRNMNSYDNRLSLGFMPIKKRTYQHAFRATGDFFNATLKANYLISLYGSKLDEGGFERLWFDVDIFDGLNATIGYVDYIGGSKYFDTIEDNDMLFANISFSF
jgi:hypothetical protein